MIPALAVAAGAVAQSVSGIGFSLVCAPILISVLGPREGVRVALLLSAALNVGLLAGRHDHVDVREGALLLVPAIAVTPLVAAATRAIDGRWVAAAAGILTVASAAALATGARWKGGLRARSALVAGALSGAMNVIGSIGGPALALYAVNAGWARDTMRSTLQAIFFVSNVVALVALGPPRLAGLVGPAAGLAAGSLLGRLLDPRVPHGAARATTLAVAALGGLVTAARALS